METIQCVPITVLQRASRRKRKALKLNVRDAAKMARVSRSAFSRIECGGSCDVKTYVRMSAWILSALPVAA